MWRVQSEWEETGACDWTRVTPRESRALSSPFRPRLCVDLQDEILPAMDLQGTLTLIEVLHMSLFFTVQKCNDHGCWHWGLHQPRGLESDHRGTWSRVHDPWLRRTASQNGRTQEFVLWFVFSSSLFLLCTVCNQLWRGLSGLRQSACGLNYCVVN